MSPRSRRAAFRTAPPMRRAVGGSSIPARPAVAAAGHARRWMSFCWSVCGHQCEVPTCLFVEGDRQRVGAAAAPPRECAGGDPTCAKPVGAGEWRVCVEALGEAHLKRAPLQMRRASHGHGGRAARTMASCQQRWGARPAPARGLMREMRSQGAATAQRRPSAARWRATSSRRGAHLVARRVVRCPPRRVRA